MPPILRAGKLVTRGGICGDGPDQSYARGGIFGGADPANIFIIQPLYVQLVLTVSTIRSDTHNQTEVLRRSIGVRLVRD